MVISLLILDFIVLNNLLYIGCKENEWMRREVRKEERLVRVELKRKEILKWYLLIREEESNEFHN